MGPRKRTWMLDQPNCKRPKPRGSVTVELEEAAGGTSVGSKSSSGGAGEAPGGQTRHEQRAAAAAAGAAEEARARAAAGAAAVAAKLQGVIDKLTEAAPLEVRAEIDRVYDCLAACQWNTRQCMHVLGIPVLTKESLGISVSHLTGNQHLFLKTFKNKESKTNSPAFKSLRSGHLLKFWMFDELGNCQHFGNFKT